MSALKVSLAGRSRGLVRLATLGVSLGALLGGMLAVAEGGTSGAAGNLYVSSSGSDIANTCTHASAPCLTLLHAYNQASAGNTIHLTGDTFPVNHLLITKDINIVGTLSGGSLDVNTSTIDAEKHAIGLEIDAPDVNLSNLIVNDATEVAIQNDGPGGLSLTNVIVGWETDAFSFESGILNAGDLSVDGGAISGNSSLGGSGLVNEPGSFALLHNVAMNHNAATGPEGEAGAIANDRGTVELTGTTAIHNNSASIDGGGIEECPQAGTHLTVGPHVSITANTPNNISSADPAVDCH